MSFTVSVGYDEAHRRYFVIASDIPGLHIEADTFEQFVDVVQDVAPDLIGAAAGGARIKFEREVALVWWAETFTLNSLDSRAKSGAISSGKPRDRTKSGAVQSRTEKQPFPRIP